jgi:DNA-damage-inducible protein D
MGTSNRFEEIKHLNEIGQEYWSGRELFKVLEYIKWDKFLNVIAKAKIACKNSGQEPEDHFPRVEKTIRMPKGAQRDIGDLHLSRYACYLIIQNADPSKEVVALGQTYFAMQTRKQEVLEQSFERLKSEGEKGFF